MLERWCDDEGYKEKRRSEEEIKKHLLSYKKKLNMDVLGNKKSDGPNGTRGFH